MATTINEILDGLADQLKEISKVLIDGKASEEYKLVSTKDVSDLFDKVNKEFADPDKLKKADFLDKKGAELYYSGMYLRAANNQAVSYKEEKRQDASISYSHGGGDSFLRTGSKQLHKGN